VDTSAIQRRRWIILGVLVVGLLAIVTDASFVDVMRITIAIAVGLAVAGAVAVSRWMPGRPRPTIEEFDQLIAREIAAAERDLAMTARPRPSAEENSTSRYLERTVASPGGSIESLDG
jgi:hypothetical protein